jgi:hypothetical protein
LTLLEEPTAQQSPALTQVTPFKLPGTQQSPALAQVNPLKLPGLGLGVLTMFQLLPA